MNIIAGERKGTVIIAPPGMDTRPTQAKIKGSLFNMIMGYVEQSRVLDLFSGSGSLALEALSRGAASAVCVDSGRESVKAIQQNIQKLRYAERCRIIAADYRQAVEQLTLQKQTFDLVFMDPPYRMHVIAECCSLLAKNHLLSDGAMLVLEHAVGTLEMVDEHFQLYKQRVYGDTEIHYYLYQAGNS